MSDFSPFETHFEGLTLHYAGLPRYSSIFLRDAFISGLLAQDSRMLHDSLRFAARTQSTDFNFVDGAEPGKIAHEYNIATHEGYSWRPILLTTYNACDTTALYLVAHEACARTHPHLLHEQRHNILQAVEYILRHVQDGFFIEHPPQGADHYALSVTYWKDSVMPTREDKDPAYPVIYTLAHAQNLRGLRSAQRLLETPATTEEKHVLTQVRAAVTAMSKALPTLFDEHNDCFLVAQDTQGPVRAVSSDSLHLLAYCAKNDVPKSLLERIVRSSEALETPLGYRTLAPDFCTHAIDRYHTHTVWPVEQALIHAGASRFSLQKVRAVTNRIQRAFAQEQDTNYELYEVDDAGVWSPGGQQQQLWTVAAKHYFASLQP